MTPLQAIEFELLKTFVQICEELHVTYYLVCGTALGAVKYGGFIPWDDDVDVALPREDYEVFCEKAPALLPPDLFLQNSRTDAAFPMIYSKLRHSGTTYIETNTAHLPIHHGVYIDVFPLDGYPSDAAQQEAIEKEKRRYELRRLACLRVPLSSKAALYVKWLKLCGVHKHPERLVRRLEKHITAVSPAESAVWCNHGNWQGQLEYAPREQYGEGVFAEFEGLTVRVPAQYDAYLTQKYGDWRAELPKEQQVGHHYYDVMDLERSYTYYR